MLYLEGLREIDSQENNGNPKGKWRGPNRSRAAWLLLSLLYYYSSTC